MVWDEALGDELIARHGVYGRQVDACLRAIDRVIAIHARCSWWNFRGRYLCVLAGRRITAKSRRARAEGQRIYREYMAMARGGE